MLVLLLSIISDHFSQEQMQTYPVRSAESHLAEQIGVRTRRRVMRRFLPFLIIAYLLAYLDRANLGVAKLQMQGDLRFTDQTVGFGAGIFFLGYFLLEIPGSLVVERYSARKWFARIMIIWGFVATLTGFIGMSWVTGISSRQQFYLARFLLGAAEAGFFPGVIVYLSHWFRYEDRTRAKSWFMMTQPLAIVVGTPLSRWILENVHGYSLPGWRWVFLLEGAPSVVLGIVALFYLTDRVHQASWLCNDQRAWLAAELAREDREKTAAGRVQTLDAFRQPQTVLLMVVLFLIVTSNQALLFFLPSITDKLPGVSVTGRTLIAAAPYLFSIMGILLNGFLSSRSGERRWHTAGPILATAVSLTFLILASAHVGLMVTLLCAVGLTFQAWLPVFWTLPTAFLGRSAAATAIGTINSVGNLGGFAGPYLFGSLKTVTGSYETGLWFLTGCMLMAGLLATQIRVERLPNKNHEEKT
jgi:MFS transporter, ACS family, tartrate transporter